MNSPPISDLHDEGDISLLLSPTKARQAAAESASWKYVDDRLKTLFAPNKVPRFERNETTLKALLELVKANEDADEERRILHEARHEALSKSPSAEESSKGTVTPREKLLSDLDAALPASGKTALDDLAASAVLLACHRGTVEDMETRIMDLTRDTFDAENELLTLQQTQKSFDREKLQLQYTIARFKAETDPETLRIEEMQQSTATMNRETKVIGMKLAEYQDRIKALRDYDVGSVSIEEIIKQERGVEERQQDLRKLEEKIVAMHGLPPDLDVSRKEVERARNELEEWKRRRDRAFEGLVE